MDANNTGFKMRNDKGNAFIIFVRYTASTGDHKMAFYFFFFFFTLCTTLAIPSQENEITNQGFDFVMFKKLVKEQIK